jgi:hypothetical protein
MTAPAPHRAGALSVLVAVLAVLVAGCAESEPRCAAVPAQPRASLVRLAPSGTVTSVATLPYGRVGVSGHVLTLTPYGGTATPVARLEPQPAADPDPVRSEGSTLLGAGGATWRVPYAGGAYLGTVADRAVVLGIDGQLRGVRLRDGELEWNARLDHRYLAAHAVVTGDQVVAVGDRWQEGESGPGRETAYAHDGRSGRLRWAQPLGAVEPSALVRLGPLLVVGASSSRTAGSVGELRAFDGRSGAPRWVSPLPDERVQWLGVQAGALVAVSVTDVPGCA